MLRKNGDSFADKVEHLCSSTTRVVLALFLLGLFVFELARFGAWIVSR
jgi:hypothetical protein